MKENQSSKKKALSEDELLDVTGGDIMGIVEAALYTQGLQYVKEIPHCCF